MTDITLEQRARDILQDEYQRTHAANPKCNLDEATWGLAHRAATQALRLSAGADWQPIETAPKDGTGILIAGGTYSVRDHYDMAFIGPCIAYWDRDHWHGNEANAHDEWCSHMPTHWQPLPAAPRHETGEG